MTNWGKKGGEIFLKLTNSINVDDSFFVSRQVSSC